MKYRRIDILLPVSESSNFPEAIEQRVHTQKTYGKPLTRLQSRLGCS